MDQKQTTFFDGTFHTGDEMEVAVIDHGCPGDRRLGDCLAVATKGEQVAVGTLVVDEEITLEEYSHRNPEVSLPDNCAAYRHWSPLTVVIPRVGIWVCEPVYESARDAWECVSRRLDLFARLLDRPLAELPVAPALFSVLDDDGVDLRGVDPLHYYDMATFVSVAESLTRRLPKTWLPSVVDDTVRELLAAGRWRDRKDRALSPRIPRWLAETTAAA